MVLRCPRITAVPQGLERRMMHPGASIAAAPLYDCCLLERFVPSFPTAIRRSHLDFWYAFPFFCSRAANLLEICRGESHYSVIGGCALISAAPDIADGLHLNDGPPASTFMVAAPGAAASGHDVMALQPRTDRWRFQTGGRKIDAGSSGFGQTMQVAKTLANIRMMRIDENIHATHPRYARVAPILHKQMRAQPVNCSITPMKGATDADGR
jgi:hypothetical protein